MQRFQKGKGFIIAVVGPTAVGKTKYSINLAKQVNGEIISADSRQVYKGLDIGSGKVTMREMRGVKHYMLDIASPKKVFSAHDFTKKAGKILEGILARGKTPIIVGGTGFYIDALFGAAVLPDVPANQLLRKKLSSRSPVENFEHLKKLDLARAKTIDRHNNVRLIRAIEIATALGKVPKIKKNTYPHPIIWMGLTAPREVLRKRIEKRLKARLAQGMLDEVSTLHTKGLSWKRMEELGLEYRYCAQYLQGQLTEKELEKMLPEKIYQYAMRQLRWFKRNKKINWIEV